MLVLSRKAGEKIVFPGIEAAIQVVSIKPNMVRLGIEAPSGIEVYRQEVLERGGRRPVAPAPNGSAAKGSAEKSSIRELRHLVRNRLNGANIGLALLRRQVQDMLTRDAEATMDRIHRELQGLKEQIEVAADKTVPPPRISRPEPARRALLVEDDQNERELLAGFLRMAGIDVVTAGDGTDALGYLRTENRPDVVLLDMVMPRCDGPTTVREIRGDPAWAGLKVFGVSGYGPERFGLEPGRGGIDRWFQKPIDPEALLRELNHEFAQGACAHA